MVRVLIVDDHTLFAEAVQAVLSLDPRIEVVGTAKDGAEGVELAATLAPDVVLMDISMPVLDGFEATEQIAAAAPGARVLVLSGSNASDDVDRARRAGAVAYATKDRIAAELVQSIIETARAQP
jgi:DNA-binding NarL/FixJ family response regulator